jgi:Domain of unknown function (DUF1929)
MAASSRPAIMSVGKKITYGATFTLEARPARSIGRVAIVRAASVTHAFSSDQRYVGLAFSPGTGDQLQVKAPPNANIAPPGFYLLFGVDNAGIPSTGSFVQVMGK